MTATIHKLTAGTGYEYLTKQVAAMDATDKGKVSLSDYYSAKGESPGVWMGSGLAGLSDLTLPHMSPSNTLTLADEAASNAATHPARTFLDVSPGSVVSAAQMRALYGEGRHPNADQIERTCVESGMSAAAALQPTKLGAEYAVYRDHPDFVRELARRFVAHNLARDEPWDAPLEAEDKARLRTKLGRERFSREYARPPRDERELAGFIARQTRQKQSAVAGYDMTFSPVKSVSTLWAIAPLPVARQIEDAHRRAVTDAITFLESQACFSRLGADGVAQVSTDGLIAAAFTHRDSRAGDPDLHTHVTIANKVRVTDPSGGSKWMALDGRPLYKAVVSASEVYNSRLEAYCEQQLGVVFSERPSLDTRKRPVREIEGVSPELMRRWSSRRAAIEARTAELAHQFQQDHGREPTSTEAFDLAQKATLETRDRKHEPRSYAEQRQAWHGEATAMLGGERQLTDMVRGVTDRHAQHDQIPLRETPLTASECATLAESVVAVVSTGRARWQRPHLRAEAERQLRSHPNVRFGTHADITAAVDAIVDTAVSREHAVAVSTDALDGDRSEPDVLRRADGVSVFVRHDTALFTTREILAAEQRIVAAARRTDGRRVDARTVDLALLEQAANDRELNAAQTAMVRALATSGRRVQAVLAPAGTGKTTAMRTLASAWTDGGGAVLGLAPTAAAATVLREELNTPTETLAKLVHVVKGMRFDAAVDQAHADPNALTRLDISSHDRARIRSILRGSTTHRRTQIPDWIRTIGPDTLLVIDEAGMAGTRELDAAVAYVCARGGSVRMVGDDQQLASISAGGVLRDVAHESGAITLSQVVRFSDPAEGAASLAFREGDPAALGFYADHHRIHIATDEVAADHAYTSWVADRNAGHDALMLASTHEAVNALNERARADRLAANPNAPRGSVALSDGLRGGVGDIICTRRNERSLRTSATDWVRNGDRWEVAELHANGSVTARNLDTRRQITLPARYVSDHVTLGYASTIHAAQGMTADTCHVVGADTLSRQLLYVAMTRGRHGNHIYLSTAETDPHNVTTPKARHPKTGIEVLESVLARDDAQQSATTAAREAIDPFQRITRAASAYDYAVGAAAEHQLGHEAIAALERGADDLFARLQPTDQRRLSEQPAWPVLRHHLAMIELTSGNALRELDEAITSGETTTALDLAAVLDWRLLPAAADGPLPWLPTVPPSLASNDLWSDYLAGRAELVTDLATAIRDTASSWDASTAPTWARPYVLAAADPALIAELAVFRAATAVDDHDRRPTGPAHPSMRTRAHQNALNGRAAQVVIQSDSLRRWEPLVAQIDNHITADPYWPELADRFSTAARAGIDVDALVRRATSEPLPTEVPAAALWWRLASELAPAAVVATDTGIRPDWINNLATVVGDQAAEAIIADPAWPGLVTAVDAADPQQWTPVELLGVADEMLHSGAEDGHVRLDEYATVLAWRVDLLVRHSAAAYDAPPPPDDTLDPDTEEAYAAQAGLDPLDPWSAPPEHTTPPTDVDADTAHVVDEDAYLDALLANEPPDEDVIHTFDDHDEPHLDDWDTLTTTAPTSDRLAPPTDLAECIALRYELSAQLAEAQSAAATLRQEIDNDTSPHLRAAMPTVTQMRHAADQQRVAEVDLENLRHERTRLEWELEKIDADIAEARRSITQLDTDNTSPSEVADPLSDTEPADITALRLQLHIRDLTWQRERLSADLDTLDTEYTTAQDNLAHAVAESGGVRITSNEVDFFRWSAEALDLEDLNDLRRTIATLTDRVWRVDLRLAHRHAATETVLAQRNSHVMPPTEVDNGTPAVVDLEHDMPHVDTQLQSWLEKDPVRMLTDEALARRLAALQRKRQGALTDLAPRRRTVGRADAVRAEHAALQDTAQRIQTALALRTQVEHADARLQHVQNALDALPTPPRRGRAAKNAYAEQHERLDTELQAAQHDKEAAVASADAAATATGIPAHQWSSVLTRAADSDLLTTELEAAHRTDRAETDAYTTAIRNRDNASADIRSSRAEQQRRAALDPDRRATEDTLRSAAKTSTRLTPAPATPIGPPRAAVQPAPSPTRDRGEGAGL